MSEQPMDTDLNSLRERAEADDGSRAPYWAPEVNEVLTGTLLYYTDGNTENGPCRIAVIERYPDGELVNVWIFRKVLVREFEEKRPQPGDGVVIKYFGQRDSQTPNGRPFHLYRLWVSRRQPVANGSAVGAPPLPPIPTPAPVAVAATPSPLPFSPDEADDDDTLPV